jgi:hypothetical protein
VILASISGSVTLSPFVHWYEKKAHADNALYPDGANLTCGGEAQSDYFQISEINAVVSPKPSHWHPPTWRSAKPRRVARPALSANRSGVLRNRRTDAPLPFTSPRPRTASAVPTSSSSRRTALAAAHLCAPGGARRFAASSSPGPASRCAAPTTAGSSASPLGDRRCVLGGHHLMRRRANPKAAAWRRHTASRRNNRPLLCSATATFLPAVALGQRSSPTSGQGRRC